MKTGTKGTGINGKGNKGSGANPSGKRRGQRSIGGSQDLTPTGKVSFDESKDTKNNIATKGNIIQSSSAALDRE